MTLNLRLTCLNVIGLLLCASAGLFGQGLERVLTQIDKVGAGLESIRAEIHQKKWTDILEEYDEGEKGEFYFLKTEKGVYLRKEIEEPTQNSLVIGESEVVFYQPAIKQAQKYNLGRHGDKAEFLLLGFGTDREALKNTYRIDLQGKEKVGDRNTVKLLLEPKSKEVAAFFTEIVLWVDVELWVPIQQKLVEPTRDHLLIRFDNIEINPDLSKSDFEVKLPKDVRVISGG